MSGAGGTGLGAEGVEQWPGRGLWLLEPGSSRGHPSALQDHRHVQGVDEQPPRAWL